MPITTNKDLMSELQNMSKLTKKQRHQVKSRWYYIFWGAATVSVFAGQMYVGSGYRQMSKAFNRMLDTVLIEVYDGQKHNGTRFY